MGGIFDGAADGGFVFEDLVLAEVEVADDGDHAELVDRENETYLVDSPWKSAIQEWITRNLGRAITSELILTEAIGKPVERQGRADQMQVASILRDLGYEKKRAWLEGRNKWVFVLPSG